MIFYNEVAQEYFEETYNDLQELFIKPVDRIALMNLANLYAQSQEMLQEVQKQGYQMEQTNARGGTTYQISPVYRAYLSAISQMDVIQSKLGLNIKSRQVLLKKEKELKTEEAELFGDI